ncbi:MAG TPA: UTP--glucose-1-phosphate uridylyltransferase [Jatrophihabitans sp.]|nr:UTP--glucose-1-phosphate uridylyltransferase [Jatrophihabitans sp.]
MSVETQFAAATKMRAAGCPDAAIATFATQLERLRSGERGVIAEADLEPLLELPDAADLAAPASERAAQLLDRTVVLKLNGGLGTSMGLAGPKSLLPVKDETTFLDLIARQVLDLRARTGGRVPLVLMNSFATREPSLRALADYPELAQDVPLEIVQNMVPKLRADDLQPVSWPTAPQLEWAPPGHGDLYSVLLTSGMLETLLAAGYRTVFVSNADNLGATLDTAILAWFVDSGAPFALEAADRTVADRKGGHLARLPGGGLALREVAQTRPEDAAAFQDIQRYRYFNTNNLWIDLAALQDLLTARGGVLELPLIVNEKTVDPADATSTPVVQLESAMGSALGSWPGARAIRVPRSRFAPVKTTNDLLITRSDAYSIDDRFHLQLAAARAGNPPIGDLDPAYYKNVADFDARFPAGVPSMIACDRLTIDGDVRFGPDVVLRGQVSLKYAGEGQLVVPAATELIC